MLNSMCFYFNNNLLEILNKIFHSQNALLYVQINVGNAFLSFYDLFAITNL